MMCNVLLKPPAANRIDQNLPIQLGRSIEGAMSDNDSLARAMQTLTTTFQQRRTASFVAFKGIAGTLPIATLLTAANLPTAYTIAINLACSPGALLYVLYYLYFSLSTNRPPIKLTPDQYATLYTYYKGCVQRSMPEPVYCYNRLRKEHAFWIVPDMAVQGHQQHELTWDEFAERYLKPPNPVAGVAGAEEEDSLEHLFEEYKALKDAVVELVVGVDAPPPTALADHENVEKKEEDASESHAILSPLQKADSEREVLHSQLVGNASKIGRDQKRRKT
ncbi:hypothetical protein DFJ77DRAFT_51176 [Powellomyces hirtus]|nr:hypothetical protein DFJ77DRAFT_51176 [Powellomyces hirtus]